MPALTNAKFKALRAALDGFTNIQKQLAPPAFPDEGLVETVHQLVQWTNKRAPRVLLPFNRDEYRDPFSNQPVRTSGLRAYVATAVPVLSVAIEDEGSITGEQLLDFSYVKNIKLRAVLQRDFRELLRATNGRCWKAAVVLSGALMEALLIDQLGNTQGAALAVSAPNKNQDDIPNWRFVDLINVAVEVRIVSKSVGKLSHSVREYRNLVHLHKELKDGLIAEEHEARIALNILNLIDRDLQR